MPSLIHNNLLRRTTLAIAAAIGLFGAVDASAGSVSVGSNQVCASYSGMSIDPAGNLTVNCSSTTSNPDSPGTFSLSTTGGSVTPGQTISLSVGRSGGTLGSVTVGVSGCGVSPTSATFTGGASGNTSVALSATAPQSGSCTITLGNPTAGVLGSSSATFTVSTGSPPPVNTAGCPAGYTPPSNLLTTTMLGSGNLLNMMAKSGQIISMPLPTTAYNSGSWAMGETPTLGSPEPVNIDISINKCPGYIDMGTYPSGTVGAACNKHSTNRNFNAIDWLQTNLADPATTAAYNMCWTADGGTYYVNVRWTMPACPSGFGETCGFQATWYKGAY